MIKNLNIIRCSLCFRQLTAHGRYNHMRTVDKKAATLFLHKKYISTKIRLDFKKHMLQYSRPQPSGFGAYHSVLTPSRGTSEYWRTFRAVFADAGCVARSSLKWSRSFPLALLQAQAGARMSGSGPGRDLDLVRAPASPTTASTGCRQTPSPGLGRISCRCRRVDPGDPERHQDRD